MSFCCRFDINSGPCSGLLSSRLIARFARRLLFGVAVLAVLAATIANVGFAQQIQTLRNQVRPEVSSGNAPLVRAMPLGQKMNFSIVLPFRNQDQLDSLLGRLYDPSSPDFHQFLTVDRFTQQFGPSIEDYQAVVAYAEANGFTVTGAPANRLVVPLSGTVSQIESAFNVQMGVYQHPVENRTFFSPNRAPSLNLSVPVAGISGLESYSLPQPMVIPPSGEQPMVASVVGSGPSGSYLGSDMRAAYYGGTTLNGNGQTVALLEFDGYYISDVQSTFSNAGQTYNVPINNVLLDGATGAPSSSNGEAEVVLDIVQAIGMAPGLSQVRVYMGAGLDDANLLNSIASENIAKQISCSWSWQPADPATDDPFFKEFAAQGQSFFTASGDYGAYDTTISPFFYPQEDAYVTAVGGTHLTTSGAGGVWSDETAWNDFPQITIGSGGGISPDSIAIPSWQSGVANTSNAGSTTLRNIPDVAMEADTDNYNCSLGTCSSGWAGTSFAAPRWAGFMALVNQQAVEAGNAPLGGIGFLNPSLYILAEGTPYTTDLHDISAGNNDTENQAVSWNAVAGYDLVTGWGSPTGQHLIDDLAGPQVPGFWIIGSPATVAVLQGATTSTTISVTDAGGFTGNVSLAITTPLPQGVTASWGTNPTTGTSVLTFTAASTAPGSTTPLTITGTSGNIKVTTTVTLAVHAPTFLLTPSPTGLGLSPSNSGTSIITITPEYGFTGAVNLSISGLPTGVTASFTPVQNGTSTLTINAGSTAVDGASNLTITGTSGNLTVTTTLSLSVHAPFFVISGPGTINVGEPATSTSTLYVFPEYQFSGSVNLSVSGLPTGVTASFSTNPVNVGPSYYPTSLTLTVGASAPIGTSQVTITGTSGSITGTFIFSLVIHQPTFTVYSPLSVDIGQGATTGAYVSVNPQYGFNGNVTFSVTGLPAGVTASWNPNPTTGSTTLALTAASSTAVGSSKLTITGTYGTVTASSITTLTVHQPTFTLNPLSAVDMGQGATYNIYPGISPQYGFSGNVTFSVTGLPAGVTALWNPNPTTSGTNLTLISSSSAPAGTHNLTITGTSGNITSSITVPLTIHTPSFTLYTPNQVSIGQGTTTTSYLSINALYGFNGNVTLSASGLPNGVTASFSPNPTTNYTTLTLTATSTATVGTSTVTITGTSGTLTASATLTLGVYAPTFTISGGGSVSLGQGSTTTAYLNVYSQYGFNGAVNFSVSGVPAGVTASFAPNPTSNSTTLTLTAASTAAIGQSTLTVTGTSGSQSATTTLQLNVVATYFTLGSGGGTVIQGSSTTSSVWIYPQYGFNGNVNLSISGLPSGITASFSPNPVPVSGTVYSTTSTLTLTAGSTVPTGQYTATITGTSGSLTATTTFYFGVYGPTFSLGSPYLTMGQGTTATTSVYVSSQNGFSGSVNLSLSGLPSGVTASFAPNPVVLASGNSLYATLTLTTTSTAPPGQYNLTLTGTSGNLTATSSASLNIYPPSFNLYCNCSFSLNDGASGQATVNVNPQYGFSSSVALSVSGLPSGVTASFAPNPASSTSALTLTAAGNAPPVSSVMVTITGTSGSLTGSTAAYVTINAQGFSLVSAPGEIHLGPGSSGQSTLGVVPLNGFASNVSFSVAGLPSGVSATFSPNPAGLSSIMTLTAAANAAPANATATITGTSGLLTAAASVAVIVGAGVPATTTTTFQISAAGNPVQSVAAGSVVTLTAAVTAGSAKLTTGQVNFCSAVSTGCDPTHLIGTAQLTSAGTAKLKFIPGMGVHSYKAVFLGTSADASSASAASSLTVTATQPTTTAIAQTGSSGNYTLTATVSGTGAVAPTGSISFIDTTNNNAVLATAGLANAQASLGWGNPQAPATGQTPAAIVIADFNGDGIPDLATANGGSGTVTILLGKGDGTFTSTGSALQAGTYPVSIVAGDFNGDGIVDLAVANNSSNNISIFLGKGDGTFTAGSTNPPTGSQPAVLVVGDFNRDGILDLATLNAGVNTVTVELGNGDGTFTPSPLSPQAGSYPRSMTSGDFNRDGIPDLAIVNLYNSGLTILLGNGDGSFTPAPPVALPQVSDPNAVATGDFNQDGKTDLAVVDSNSSSIYIFLGNGDGSFTAAANVTGLSSPSHISVGDFNGDGKPDLVETNYSQMGILLGNGDGTFAATQGISAGINPYAIAVGDLNGDGTEDVVVTNANGANILTSQISQTVTAVATSVSPAGTGTHNVEASYPGDSGYKASVSTTVGLVAQLVTPVVTVTPASSNITTIQPLSVTVTVAGTSGNTTPSGSVTLSSGSYSSGARTLSGGSATVLIPGGSLPIGADTLAATYTPDSGSASTYNSATGTAPVTVSQATSSCTINPNPNPNPAAFANPGDFNGDCRSDILWRNNTTGEVDLWIMNGTSITSAANLGTIATNWTIAGLGDFNGDGRSDILWRNSTTGEVDLWLMNGTAITGAVNLGTIATNWTIGGLGDFNGDGRSDILWRNNSTGEVDLWIMNGTAITGAVNLGTIATNWTIAALGDFNGDGRSDILWRNNSTGEVDLWIMNGTAITSAVNLGTIATNWSITGLGDFNGDGRSDILWRNNSTGEVDLWIMNGTAITGAANLGTIATNWTIADLGDFNGDGRSDILWRNNSTGEVDLWTMNGTAITSAASLGAISSGWQIVNPSP